MSLSVDPHSERLLSSLQRIATQQSRLQREISSGHRVSHPSDAPEAVVDIVQLQSSAEHATGVSNSIDRLQSEVNSADSAVRAAERLMDRVRTLAAMAATGTAGSRKAIGLEVRQIHEQLVGLSQSTFAGDFLFNGDLAETTLYTSDWSQPRGVVRHAIASETKQAEDVHGRRFVYSRTAHELFDVLEADGTPAPGNVFHAVHSLGLSIETEDVAAIQAAIPGIMRAQEHLNEHLVFFGATQNRLGEAKKLAEEASIVHRTALSQLRDTNLPQAILELTQVKVQQEAALAASAQRPRKTLFDYLA